MAAPWNEENTELLKKLWLEGLSASQIAGVLGVEVTRNAVIGKIHRLKLTGRAKGSSAHVAKVRSRTSHVRRQQPRMPFAGRSITQGISSSPSSQIHGGVIAALDRKGNMDEGFEIDAYRPTPDLFIPIESRLTLLQIGEKTCKWPIGDPLTPEFHFCGLYPENGRPYCEFHSRRAYHQLEKKKRRTA